MNDQDEALLQIHTAAKRVFSAYMAELRNEDPEAADGLAVALQQGAILHVEHSTSLAGMLRADLFITLGDGTKQHLAALEREPIARLDTAH